ncbi:MAG TPA: response regulator transcription factor [Microbacterium sp.]|uniref:response regulator transcription factor n=1 Tax=Microbacterium sp. TaxID=51671 RepID=UPI002C4F49C0|nr:response regulator transcription factor [Microbacterium sp.]HWI32051.1 response regulator transcription factor [Microbacterium sp.]
MPGDAFKKVFWDIVAEVPVDVFAEPDDAGGIPVQSARVAVVVEDEPDIRSLLADVLEQAGFVVHTASTGLEGIELVRDHEPVVTTLDVSMPGMDGFETAKRIRTFSATYLVMLTARSDEIDTLQGLQSGADDYITKPFRPRELRARIEAMLRRPRIIQTTDAGDAEAAPMPAPSLPPASESAEWLEHRGLRLHPGMRIVVLAGSEVDLTRSEFDILCDLLESGRRVVSKGDLAILLRGDRGTGSDYVTDHDVRTIEVHVANLRRKLGESPVHPKWIETVRGAGYRLTAG